MKGGASRVLLFLWKLLQLLLPFSISNILEMASFPPPTPPFFGFLEMEQGWKKERMEIPIASLFAEQWLRWDLDEGDGRGREMESALEGEAKRLLSRWYGPNYSSALSLPVIVVSGSQRVLEICWNSRDLGFPPGMELNFPLGTTCPALIFGRGAG